MIVAILSLVAYVADPMLGVILAIVLPSVITLDNDGSYGEVLMVIMLAIALYFVRHTGFEKE